MLKRDIADRLHILALRRYRKENPEYELSNDEMTTMWYRIYDIVRRDREEKAEGFVKTAELKQL